LVSEGAIRPHVGQRIGLDGVGAALEAHENRTTTGRTIVVIAPDQSGRGAARTSG
jgi:NADPH2:quinone reductase